MRVTIKHQMEKTYHTFKVQDENNLSLNEVKRICDRMGVDMLFINGKIYSTDNNQDLSVDFKLDDK